MHLINPFTAITLISASASSSIVNAVHLDESNTKLRSRFIKEKRTGKKVIKHPPKKSSPAKNAPGTASSLAVVTPEPTSKPTEAPTAVAIELSSIPLPTPHLVIEQTAPNTAPTPSNASVSGPKNPHSTAQTSEEVKIYSVYNGTQYADTTIIENDTSNGKKEEEQKEKVKPEKQPENLIMDQTSNAEASGTNITQSDVSTGKKNDQKEKVKPEKTLGSSLNQTTESQGNDGKKKKPEKTDDEVAEGKKKEQVDAKPVKGKKKGHKSEVETEGETQLASSAIAETVIESSVQLEVATDTHFESGGNDATQTGNIPNKGFRSSPPKTDTVVAVPTDHSAIEQQPENSASLQKNYKVKMPTILAAGTTVFSFFA